MERGRGVVIIAIASLVLAAVLWAAFLRSDDLQEPAVVIQADALNGPGTDALVACAGSAGIRLHDASGQWFGTVTQSDVENIEWSPDGNLIAFHVWHDTFVVALNGGRESSLGPGFLPSWSPDSSLVAIGPYGDSGSTLDISRPDGQDRRTLTEDAVAGERPSWSPSGTQLAYASESGLRIVDTFGIASPSLHGGDVTHPMWSPDGSLIAYVAVDATAGVALFVVDPLGLQSRLVAPLPSYRALQLAWSPEGSRIVVVTDDVLQSVSLWGETPLTTKLPSAVHGPLSWSPDGSLIMIPAGTSYTMTADLLDVRPFAPIDNLCQAAAFRSTDDPLPFGDPPSPPPTAVASSIPPPEKIEDYGGFDYVGSPPLPPGSTYLGRRVLTNGLWGPLYAVEQLVYNGRSAMLFVRDLRDSAEPHWQVFTMLFFGDRHPGYVLDDCSNYGRHDQNLIVWFETLTDEEFQTPAIALEFDVVSRQAIPVNPEGITCRLHSS